MCDDMKLPEGMSCVDCSHIRRCMALGIFGEDEYPSSVKSCDWSPSRFNKSVISEPLKNCPISGVGGW